MQYLISRQCHSGQRPKRNFAQVTGITGNLAVLVTRTICDDSDWAVITTVSYLEGTSEAITESQTLYDDSGCATTLRLLEGVELSQVDMIGPAVVIDGVSVRIRSETVYVAG